MSDEHEQDLAAEAEEERLDAETPSALDELSATAQKFLEDPEVDAAANRDLADDATGEEPPQDGDPAR